MEIAEEKKRIIVVMPAYNAELTVENTLRALPRVYDEVLLCDDGSRDDTTKRSAELGITTVGHATNKGYGANQKTLYSLALEKHADIIVMVHPDNQYNTSRISEMIGIVKRGEADLVLGSRMATARTHGMPWWKYCGNRFLTFFQNRIFKTHFSEFHSGLRVYDAHALARMPWHTFSDNFVFDSETIAWFLANGYGIREVPTECYYNEKASSLNFCRSVVYGLATLVTLLRFLRGEYAAHFFERSK